jgi:hypothetical protein
LPGTRPSPPPPDAKGLRVQAEFDTNDYPTGVTISDAHVATKYLLPDAFHGEWNYALQPRLTL